MGSDQIIFFHGFWGQIEDAPRGTVGIEYTKIPSLNPENFLSDWGQNFHAWKLQNFGPKPVRAVGYSQGGRLLLQALHAFPEDFEKLVLISSHPGLQSVAEKENRLAHDRQWAKKFRNLEWAQLEDEWNAQSVFKKDSVQRRDEIKSDREMLALCFENWSLAHQQDFRKTMLAHTDKISVVLGEEDSKYIQIYSEFWKAHLVKAKGAAHRVPFDQPELTAEILKSIFG